MSQIGLFLQTLGAAKDKQAFALLAAGIVLVIVATTGLQIRLNAWNQPFYDALAQRNAADFVRQLLVFAMIAGPLLALNVAQTWLHEMVKVRLRSWLTGDLIAEWLQPGRAYRLVWAGGVAVNPDQRLHEDSRHLAELSADLGVGLLQSGLLLLSFVGVLWLLSEDVVFVLQGRSLAIPGYMVWCALLYAATASWLSWRVGRPLIGLNDERYAQEAELRFALVRVSENADGIALGAGEADERQRLQQELDQVLTAMRRIVGAVTRLTWVTSGYGWFALVAPILVAAPAYFTGSLTFGNLMMAVGAFLQVQQALRWFVDNFGRIADWRATLGRIADFREALLRIDGHDGQTDRIEILDHPAGGLAFDHLAVTTAAGRAALTETQVEIAPGDRILILGRPGSGKSTLFRAFAGLWPWGTGRLLLPPRDSMMFLPQRPYMPLGPLRAALSYPADPAGVGDDALVAALDRTGLGYLVPDLDSTRRWDRELSMDEQQRVAFARLLLHKPRWVFIDEAIDLLDEDHRRIVLAIFRKELADAAVISIGRRAARPGFYARTLHLSRYPAAKSHAPRSPSRSESDAAA
ncbi:ABC transporter ATP-binding protein/permease [Mycobacterium sp. KBS0706]|uniref:ABC transporter ATP-binding protein/permease n=1 Tax=Mycobacterium sp. KBS0706 TaxID=2578109 RepID=UPI00163DD054|nr:ABC transporter ATP-binding protein/permease [Mycobacterium sp. KBS0706]